jgi:hypothetical protein
MLRFPLEAGAARDVEGAEAGWLKRWKPPDPVLWLAGAERV